LIISVDGQKFSLRDFTNNEGDFESFVELNSRDIFGETSIYLSKTKIKSASGIGVIPDAFLITLEPHAQWYIVEVELSSHPIYDHVHNQVMRFLGAVKDPATQQRLLDFFDEKILLEHRDKLALIKERNPEVFKFLWNLLKKPPTILIIIDRKDKELTDVVNSLAPNNVQALEFKVFGKVDDSEKFAFLIEPLFQSTPVIRLVSKPVSLPQGQLPSITPRVATGEVTYWITSVNDDNVETAEEAITKLIGNYGIYGFGDSTGGRRALKVGDMICFYRSGSGIAAQAKITSNPVRKPDSRIRDAERYPWTFDLTETKVYLDSPITLDENLRTRLDAFQGKDAKHNWSWFVQSTHTISRHDFYLLIGQQQ
jgi:EVE domain